MEPGNGIGKPFAYAKGKTHVDLFLNSQGSNPRETFFALVFGFRASYLYMYPSPLGM